MPMGLIARKMSFYHLLLRRLARSDLLVRRFLAFWDIPRVAQVAVMYVVTKDWCHL